MWMAWLTRMLLDLELYPFTFPTADGTANYVLKTNGSGQLAWAADSYENYDYKVSKNWI